MPKSIPSATLLKLNKMAEPVGCCVVAEPDSGGPYVVYGMEMGTRTDDNVFTGSVSEVMDWLAGARWYMEHGEVL